MADNTEKKVLIDVEIKAKEALKEYANLKIKVDELSVAQEVLKIKMKGVDDSTDEGKEKIAKLRLEYETIGQQIKAYNKEAQNQQKEIQNNIRYQNEAAGSLQKLKSELSLNTTAFNKLSEAERNSVKGQMLQRQIQETTDKLKEEEKALGNHRREVGNYAIAGQSLRSEMKELVDTLTRMKLAGDENSEQFKEMTARLAELRDAFGDVSQGANQLASDTNKLDATTQIVQVAAGAMAGFQAIIASGTEVSDEYLQVMKNMQIAITALSALTAVQNSIQKQTIAYRMAESLLLKAGINQTVKAAAAEAAWNAIKTSGTIATKAAAVAQWLWNAALAANPVILIAVAVAALIVGLVKFTNALSASARTQREAEAASKTYEAQQQKTAATLDNINNREKNASNERNNRLRQEILDMKKNGATAEEIAKVQAKGAQDVRDIEIKAAKEREEANRALWKSAKANIEAQQANLNTLGKGTDKYREQLKVVSDLIIANNQLAQTITDDVQKQIDINLQSAEAADKAAKERKQKYQDTASKMLDLQKKFQDEQNKLIDAGAKRDFLSQQRRDEDLFEQNQKYERDKLDMQRKFGTVTKTEYDKQNQILSTQNQAFYQKQVADAEAYYKQQRDNVFKLIRQSVTAQIDEINSQYNAALKTLNTKVPEPTQKEGQSKEDFEKEKREYADYMLNRAAYAVDLERERDKQISEIRNSNYTKLLNDFDKALNEQYAVDLVKFADNEAEKNRIEAEMLQQRKAELDGMLQSGKISEERYAREVADVEVQQRSNASQAIGQQLNRDLINAQNNAESAYEAKKEALQKELELYRGNADKQREIQQELAENEREIIQQRIARFEEWSGRITEILGAMNDIAAANDEAELQRYQEINDQKKASLQQRLDSGIISQEEYDKGVAAADAELDRKQKEIARQQAIREKALKAFEIGINTAAAIMKNTAQLGLPAAIPVNIATAVLGAVQLAAVLAKPLPKAARGALLKGASHAEGGIMIEAEGGEAIINKRSTAMFAPLLSAINQAGGGIPFARPYSDGGYIQRTVNNTYGGLSEKQIENAMERAVAKQKIYLAVEDYRRADANYAIINDLSNN